VDVLSNVVLSGEGKDDDDGVRRGEVNSVVVVASTIVWRRRAERQPEVVVSLVRTSMIPSAWRHSARAVWQRKERGMGFYRRCWLALGARVCGDGDGIGRRRWLA
jgi:hypothetical protein